MKNKIKGNKYLKQNVLKENKGSKQNVLKAVVFDNNGVLTLGKYSIKELRRHKTLGVHKFMAKKLKINLDSWFDAIDTPYAMSIEGKLSRAKTISIISKNVNISSEKLIRLFKKAYNRIFKENKKLFKIAFKLKEKGYRIGVLSDQWWLSKEFLLSSKTRKFNPVIISCDVGVRKPDIKMYKLMIKRLGLKPEEILFIDDRVWNIKGAKKAGIKTILFKSNREFVRDLKKFEIEL